MIEDQSSYFMNCHFLKARNELPQRKELCLPLWQKLSTFCCIEATGEFREEEEEEEAGGKGRR